MFESWYIGPVSYCGIIHGKTCVHLVCVVWICSVKCVLFIAVDDVKEDGKRR